MSDFNVNQAVDESKMSRMQWQLFWAAMVIIIFDGYDLIIYGVTLPFLMEQWSLSPVAGGLVASITLVGMMIGAIVFGTLSDKLEKFGYTRKKIIIFCLIFFSLFSGLCGFAQSPESFTYFRFLSGLGLGGVMPNIIALVTEYAPKKLKATLVTMMFSGYAIGGVCAALFGKMFIAEHGWQVMYFIAGLPLLFIWLFIKKLPESIDYLVRSKQFDQASGILQRMDIHVPTHSQLTLNMQNLNSVQKPFLELFQQGRAGVTLLFWACAFMCLVLIYGLSSWLPKLMIMAGYDFSKSLTFLLILNVGAILGSFFGGFLGDRFGLDKMLFILMAMGTLALYMLSFMPSPSIMYLCILFAGAAAFGGQNLLLAYIAQFYQSNIRSTGIGYTLGIGRLGAISGPFLGGWMLSLQLPLSFNFMMLAVPALFGLICICILMAIQKNYAKKYLLST